MDPNEVWKNLLLAIRAGDTVLAQRYAFSLTWSIQKEGKCPAGLWKAILESEISE